MSGSEEIVTAALRHLDLIAVVTNALLGAAVARQFRLDAVGFAVLSIVSALGGGVIRDVMLDQTPVALTDRAYLGCALGAAVVAFFVRFEGRRWRQVFPYVDAVALGAWAVAGTQKSLLYGLSPLPAMLLGVLTAVGGGAVRDIMLGQVPQILRQSELYASAALAAAAAYVALDALEVEVWAAPAALVVGAGLCLLARRRGWVVPTEGRLPTPRLPGAVPQKAVNSFSKLGRQVSSRRSKRW